MRLTLIVKSLIIVSLLGCSQKSLLSEKIAERIEADDRNTASEFRQFMKYTRQKARQKDDMYPIEKFLNDRTSRICSMGTAIEIKEQTNHASEIFNLYIIGYEEYGDGEITDSRKLSERVVEESLMLTCPEKLN